MSLAHQSEVNKLKQRIEALESRLGNLPYETKGILKAELTSNATVVEQAEAQFGLYTALCVETIDIWKQNRVRWFSPIFHNHKQPVKELPWAFPVSSMGGFDDCGLSWVPPAGSTLCILFECGNRASPYYIGTTWPRNRGPAGAHTWGYNIDEYYKIWEGHRGGYLVGPDDESQVLPPWGPESYNGFDLTSVVDFSSDPEAQRRITYPNIYGFKTPEKHMIKMVDGDPNCGRKWKRFEWMSGGGNWCMMKDDHLHYAGQWAHPDCGVPEGDVSCVEGQDEGGEITSFGLGFSETQNNGIPIKGQRKETTSCSGNIIGGHPSTGHPKSKHHKKQVGANPFFKHRHECRPYRGPGTEQNNTCDLPQSGIQWMSISGNTFVMDDSVEEPSGDPTWERSTQNFSYGCNNIYLGRCYWKTAHGHVIEMSDMEDSAENRGENNYVRILTGSGNRIELNDHTKGCVAGEKRGITMESTSKHLFEMIDEGNEQCSPVRKEGGVPVARAKKARIRMRTGYGLEFLMKDENSQENTVQQTIQLFCPQKDNLDRGPHIQRFQESATGPGLVFLRVGGNYFISTHDDSVEIVGDEELNPADKIEIISRTKLVHTKDCYVNVSEKMQIFHAKEMIMLMAGEDCGPGCTPGGDPCIGPVLVYDLCTGTIKLSDRVYASASPDAKPASMFMMDPFR